MATYMQEEDYNEDTFRLDEVSESEAELEEEDSETERKDESKTTKPTPELGSSGLFKLHAILVPASPEIVTEFKRYIFEIDIKGLPVFYVKLNEGKAIVFPIPIEKLFEAKNKYILITAWAKEDCIGRGNIDVNKEFKDLEKNYRDPDAEPEIISKDANVDIVFEQSHLGTLHLKLDMQLLGTVEVTDVGKYEDEEEEEFKEPEYDEYTAEINGHSLNIKILKKKEPDEDEEECTCIGESKKNTVPSGGVGRKGSQIIFQMPTKQELCTKFPPNAVSYNVATCTKGEEHGHGNELIKINEGNSVDGEAAKADTFVLKIGKRSGPNLNRGRLELELTAPKPLTEEDFKKPVMSKACQTKDSGDGTNKKKKKKK